MILRQFLHKEPIAMSCLFGFRCEVNTLSSIRWPSVAGTLEMGSVAMLPSRLYNRSSYLVCHNTV
jgi:hypothetical protein